MALPPRLKRLNPLPNMSICLSCYKPIEEEKVKVLPDARYCMACAKKQYGGGQRRTQTELFQDEVRRDLAVEQRRIIPVNSKGYAPNGVKYVQYAQSTKLVKRPAVLKEEVFDDGRPSQATVLVRIIKKRKRSKVKAVAPSGPSVWRYESSEEPMVGDVIFTENKMCSEYDHLWTVDTVETNMVSCHCEEKPSWKHTFYIRAMKLVFRKETVPA